MILSVANPLPAVKNGWGVPLQATPRRLSSRCSAHLLWAPIGLRATRLMSRVSVSHHPQKTTTIFRRTVASGIILLFPLQWSTIARLAAPSASSRTIYFGYAWATGIGPGSVGRRVKARFAYDGNCRKPFMTALEEAKCFTSKRSLPVPVANSDLDMSAFDFRKSFSSGSFFKIAIGSPTAHSLRSWHGTNLYCVHSIFARGMLSNKPNHGPDGIYSFSDKHIDKINFYCDYVLSGTGRRHHRRRYLAPRAPSL